MGVIVWNLETADVFKKLSRNGHSTGSMRSMHAAPAPRAVNTIAVSWKDRRVLSGSDDTTLKLWDLDTGNCLETFRGHEGRVVSVSMSWESARGLSCCDRGMLLMWNLQTPENLPCPRNITSHQANACIRLVVDWVSDTALCVCSTCFEVWDLLQRECV